MGGVCLLNTCSFLTPPTRKQYKRDQFASFFISSVNGFFVTSAFNFLQSTCPAAAKEERDLAKGEPSAIAKCSGTTSRESPKSVEKIQNSRISSFFEFQPAIRRLARRGGVKRISGLIYEETRGVLKVGSKTTILCQIQRVADVPGERDS